MGIHVVSAMLANEARVGPDGLLYMNGAGWEHFTPAAFPVAVAGWLAAVVEFDEPGIAPVRLAVRNENGDDAGFTTSLLLGAVGRIVPLVLGFSVVVEAPGELTFSLEDDGGPLVSLSLPVRALTLDPG